MKILIYNWVDYFHNPTRGGGVTIYIRNLINQLRGRHEIYFVSSGESYNPFTPSIYWVEKGSDKGVRLFEIVNSEVLAPGRLAWNDPASLESPRTQNVWNSLLLKIKPDIVHFNNIEGLPISALDIKSVLPHCRVIYSLHNYYPFCPTVQLWCGNKISCRDFVNGEACVGCQPEIDRRRELLVKSLKWLYRQFKYEVPGSLYHWIFSPRWLPETLCRLLIWNHRQLAQSISPSLSHEYFKVRRENMVAKINMHCEVVLAVSARVKELAEEFGVDADILHVSYIGTKVAQNIIAPRHSDIKEPLTLIYLGYMSHEKGFYFLLDVLNALPEKIARSINLVVAAKNTDASALHRLMVLESKFNSIDYHNGYSHSQLSHLFAMADVSLVPVLWEDNLPQVAIESVCHGVPVLSSQMGGAPELSKNNAGLTFPAGDVVACCQILSRLVQDRTMLMDYWLDMSYPPTMQVHVKALEAYYGGLFDAR
ncbi:glycosyltransferase [Aeromonas dhakensis]|uniref:glycosyltransferase n=1 Tax=Aeromonas dhakensis TaxID=196024 RepID=UPI0035712658